MRRNGRRRPLLGAAVVVGASRSAARSEVARQARISSEAQESAQRAAEAKRREEEMNQMRTQQAIDDAIEKERDRMALAEARSRNATPIAVMPMSSGYAGAPQVHSTVNRSVEPGPRMELNTRYCPQCRNVCKLEDRFCGGCGLQQPVAEARPYIAAQEIRTM